MGSRKKDKKEKVSEGKKRKKWLAPAVCIFGSFLLCILLSLSRKGQDIISSDGRIYRDGYGGDEKEYQVMVEGLQEQEIPVTVRVRAQDYTAQEAEKAFERIMEGMEIQIRGENPSLMEVRSDLELPSAIEGVRLRWRSSDAEVLDASGKLRKEVEKEQMILLTAELAAGDCQQVYEILVRVLPKEQSTQEQQRADFLKELEKQDQKQQGEPWLTLPDSFRGRKLKYRLKEDSGYRMIFLLGILLAVLLAMREKSEEKQRRQKRDKELLLDYSEILCKVVVLIGAGLTIRNAWERVVFDYEEGLRSGKQRVRAAYEEMRCTCHQMQSGMAETDAYREFGRRCRLQPYLKLSSLLEQNRKTGTKNMRAILQTEMADALEQRKNLARRLGEEAGTKLLLPLFMMLGIVMVIIMVPAMMTMG